MRIPIARRESQTIFFPFGPLIRAKEIGSRKADMNQREKKMRIDAMKESDEEEGAEEKDLEISFLPFGSTKNMK